MWEKIRNLSHYRRAALVVLTVSVGLLVLFFCTGLPSTLFFSQWFLNIIPIPAFIANMLASATYIGGTLDLYQEALPNEGQKTERFFTLTAILIGLAFGITLSLLLTPVTLFSFVSTTAALTGSIAGIGNRFGSFWRRPGFEKKALSLAAMIGFSLALLALTPTALAPIACIMTFITGSTVFSPMISSILFLCLATSLCMSGMDYFSKAVSHGLDWYRYHRQTRYHEYRGSFFGSLLSTAATLFFIIHFHLPLVAAASVIVVARCFSLDSIFSRVGRTLDGLFEKNDTLAHKMGKVFLVITGIAGLIVISDMVRQGIEHVFGKKARQDNTEPHHSSTAHASTIFRKRTSSPPTAQPIRSPRPTLRTAPQGENFVSKWLRNFSLFSCCLRASSSLSSPVPSHNKQATPAFQNL